MRLYNRLVLIWRMYTKRVFTTILLFSMCIMSFYMVDEVLQNYYSSRYRIDKVINEFGVDLKDINYIKIVDKTATDKTSDSIKAYVKMLDGVESCGYYTNFSTDNISGIDSVNIVCAEQQLRNMGNLKLTDEQKEALEKDWGEYEPVLLGHDYQEIVDIGTIFNLSYFYEDKDCVVAGFLEKGAAWPQSADTLFGGTFGNDVYTLDRSGILLTDRYERYNNALGEPSIVYYMTVHNGSDEITQKITDFCIDNKIGAGVHNIYDVVNQEIEDNNISDDKVFMAAVLLVLLAMVSVTATSVIYALMSKSEFGIMIVCGVERKDVLSIMVIYNAIIYMVSAFIAWTSRQLELFGALIPNQGEGLSEVMYLAQFVPHNIYIPLLFAIIIVGMLIVSSLLPLYLIGRESLSGLLYSRNS